MWHKYERKDFTPKKRLFLSRGSKFYLIVNKFDIYVGLVKIHIAFVNKLCDINRRGRTFVQRKSFDPL